MRFRPFDDDDFLAYRADDEFVAGLEVERLAGFARDDDLVF